MEIITDALSSLGRVLLGVGLGSILGLLFAVIRLYLPHRIQNLFLTRIIFDAPKYPPPIAWIPVVIILFGIGTFSSVVVVAIGALPPVFTQIYDGFLRMSQRLKMVADNMEIDGLQRLTHVMLPSILPEIFTGLRVALGMGWMSIIAAEMVAGQSGLGYAIQLHRLNLEYSMMLFDLTLIGVIGFALQEFAKLLEKHFCQWKRIS